MSQQGERSAADDDWWNRLYDESAADAGGSAAGDTLDDRFASATDAVAAGEPPVPARESAPDASREPGAGSGRDPSGGPPGHRAADVERPAAAGARPAEPSGDHPGRAPDPAGAGEPSRSGTAGAGSDAPRRPRAWWEHPAAPPEPRAVWEPPVRPVSDVPPPGSDASPPPPAAGPAAPAPPAPAPRGTAPDLPPPPDPRDPGVPGPAPRSAQPVRPDAASGPAGPPRPPRPRTPPPPTAPPRAGSAGEPPLPPRPTRSPASGRGGRPALPPRPERPAAALPRGDGRGAEPPPWAPPPEPAGGPSSSRPAPGRVPPHRLLDVPDGVAPPPQAPPVAPPTAGQPLPEAPPAVRAPGVRGAALAAAGGAAPADPAPDAPPPDAPGAGEPGTAEGEDGAGGGAGAGEGPARGGLPDAWRRGDTLTGPRPAVSHVGTRPPTYDPEPTALPPARVDDLADTVPDTVLDGARYGTYTLRAASVRGDSARYRGEPRRDALLTARFGAGADALLLVAVATGARAAEDAHRAAADACLWIGGAVGRSHARLCDDMKDGRAAALKSGLQRLTDRTYGRLRARAEERGLASGAYTASLRCLLLPADPRVRSRVFFGVGPGGLFRLRDGAWRELEPPEEPAAGGWEAEPPETPDGDRLTMDLGIPQPRPPFVEGPVPPPAQPFRFHASTAHPGDVLLLCSAGLAEPLRGETALAGEFAERWTGPEAPGLAAYLADVQLRAKGYADDRTAAAVWEV